ncbi:hypothetical protein MAR_024943 [Mya arenaria]|uniref:Uncharacterized protein n=1 Tax=Mya arenaria TaxID=6604 RepID=A0ABY7DW81_MYAAR|nr:hypothetical protein MAR_024943 [Mya arenaria]
MTDPLRKNTTIAAVAEEVQGVKNSALVAQNVRRTIDCSECDKPRCVYSKKSLTLRDSRSLGRLLEKYDYTRGSLITPEVFVRLQLSCISPIEFAYYASSSTTKKDICCHCAADNSERDADLLTKFRVVLPICNACRNDGKER